MVKEGLTEKVTFDQSIEGGEKGSHEDFWKTVHAKALRLACV